ncbi:hypothetical protein SUGI_0222890 [Cryptomeria japonica]|nr:hypothetical protein SUGI_0222890 [Cryptomeria japonica]
MSSNKNRSVNAGQREIMSRQDESIKAYPLSAQWNFPKPNRIFDGRKKLEHHERIGMLEIKSEIFQLFLMIANLNVTSRSINILPNLYATPEKREAPPRESRCPLASPPTRVWTKLYLQKKLKKTRHGAFTRVRFDLEFDPKEKFED